MKLLAKLKNKISKPKRIFLDYASATPIHPEVLKEMMLLDKSFANPSALYQEGLEIKKIINNCRENISAIIGAQKNEIIFTSGGTESNNLALLGVFDYFNRDGFTPHFITTEIEHPSIIEVFNEIQGRGGEVTFLKVDSNGLVSLKDLKEALKENTVLVSIAHANSEIGTIQPILEIGRLIKDFRMKKNSAEDDLTPYFHVDASQSFLYLPINVLSLGISLLTIDGGKIYGPKSSGLLYVRGGIKIKPLFFGGGQEGGLRSGTENASLIAGLSKAIEIVEEKRKDESARLTTIRDYAINSILDSFPGSSLNGDGDSRLPNNINICFPGKDSEFLVISLDVLGISASYASSCKTLKEEDSSYVILALGKDGCSKSSLRFTLGRESNKTDIDSLLKALKQVLK